MKLWRLPSTSYAIKVWMVNFHAHLGEKDVLLDVRKKGDMEDLLRLSIPSNHCGSHHQISVWVQGAWQSTRLRSSCWSFSAHTNKTLVWTWRQHVPCWLKSNITFISFISAISFSILSDSFSDAFSASFISTNYINHTDTEEVINIWRRQQSKWLFSIAMQWLSGKERKVKIVKRAVNPHQSIKLWLVLRSDSVNILGDLYACNVSMVHATLRG